MSLRLAKNAAYCFVWGAIVWFFITAPGCAWLRHPEHYDDRESDAELREPNISTGNRYRTRDPYTKPLGINSQAREIERSLGVE